MSDCKSFLLDHLQKELRRVERAITVELERRNAIEKHPQVEKKKYDEIPIQSKVQSVKRVGTVYSKEGATTRPKSSPAMRHHIHVHLADSKKKQVSSKNVAKRVLNDTEEKFKRIALQLSDDEIKELLSSNAVKESLGRLGLRTWDILRRDIAQRFTQLGNDPMVLEHIEKKRVESLTSLLLEREIVLRDALVTPSESDVTSKSLATHICSKIKSESKFRRAKKFEKHEDKLNQMIDWEEQLFLERKQKQEQFEQAVRVRELRVQEARKRKQEAVQKTLQRKFEANQHAKEMQETKKSALRKKLLEKQNETESRIRRQSMNLFGGDESKNSKSLKPNKKEEHRKQVLEAARIRDEQKFAALEAKQRRKEMQLDNIRKQADYKAKHDQSKSKMAEIDKVMKLERLHEMDKYKSIRASGKLRQKDEYLTSLQHLQSEIALEKKSDEQRMFFIKSRRQASLETRLSSLSPGPGSYVVNSGLSDRGVLISQHDHKKVEEQQMRKESLLPGPGAYSAAPSSPSKAPYLTPGVSFPKGLVPSSLDSEVRNKAFVPGPGQYRPSGYLSQSSPSFSMGSLNSERLKEIRSRLKVPSPGPAHYTIGKA